MHRPPDVPTQIVRSNDRWRLPCPRDALRDRALLPAATLCPDKLPPPPAEHWRPARRQFLKMPRRQGEVWARGSSQGSRGVAAWQPPPKIGMPPEVPPRPSRTRPRLRRCACSAAHATCPCIRSPGRVFVIRRRSETKSTGDARLKPPRIAQRRSSTLRLDSR